MLDEGLFKLLRLVEVKDASTAAHTWRVALYAQALAESMEMEIPVVQRVMRAAALHDVGKIDVPREILTKPGPLTDDERAIMQQHTVNGHARLLRMGEDDQLALDVVRSHHERIDGSGYPDGLKGESIPVAARMFAVIDTFDAMTSVRPYRAQTDQSATSRALAELHMHAGAWYCPEAVDRFTSLYASGRLAWIQKHYNDQSSMASAPEPMKREEAQGATGMYIWREINGKEVLVPAE